MLKRVKNQHAAGDGCFAAVGSTAGYSTFSWPELPPSGNGKVSSCVAALCALKGTFLHPFPFFEGGVSPLFLSLST